MSMNRIKKIVAGALCMIALLLSSGIIAYADDIGAGGTGEGDGGGGSNVYTFSYLYDSSSD